MREKNIMSKLYFTYIQANKRPTLYVGMSNNLPRRNFEHKNKINPKSFTAKYGVNKVVYYQVFDNPKAAIIREKQLKNMKRVEKFNLIRKFNPYWKDLSLEFES
jgi:putative endonuclease